MTKQPMNEPPTKLDQWNAMPVDQATELARSCCGAAAWCRSLVDQRPHEDVDDLHVAADVAFDTLSDQAWIEAFSCHPKIGDLESLKMKFAGNRTWSLGEQAGVADADTATVERLAVANQQYEARFGYIFIVCASGLSAAEMLRRLLARLDNPASDELVLAAAEQRKITHLRINKLFL